MIQTTNTNALHIEYAVAHNIREKILLHFFAAIGPLHKILYKKRPIWGISTTQLLHYNTDTLGYQVGKFLQNENLEPIPRAERHDVFHVLLQYNSSVVQEAAMQFCILGAGKKSATVLATVFLAIIFLPEHFVYFKQQYIRGKSFNNFYNLPFKNLLNYNLNYLQTQILKNEH